MFRHGDRPLIAPLPSRASLFGLAGAPLRLGTTGGPTVADARVLDVLETVEREARETTVGQTYRRATAAQSVAL